MQILCAEYDPSRAHGDVTWRTYKGLPVVEIVNNWQCESFADSYRSPIIGDRIGDVLRAVQPDVIHVHNLLNLSFELPEIAARRAVPVVATLHDYALVCPSGGQRLHRAGEHVCHSIDTERCVQCFRESPFYSQMSFGRIAKTARAPQAVRRAAVQFIRRFSGLAAQASRVAARTAFVPVTRSDIDDRLAAARRVFDDIDLFVAPSPSIASEFQRLGMSGAKIRVSDYGFAPLAVSERSESNRLGKNGGRRRSKRLAIGFVGTLVWHKGVHVLIDAVRRLPADAYELMIFGDPNVFPEYTARLRELAAGAPVRFMGAFDRDRTGEIYSQIDVLVVPSLWLENSPLVIHEAFMAGVPVVGARIGGIPDLVTEGTNGFLYDPQSADALRCALQRLIDQPILVDRLSAAVPPVKSIADDAREWERTYADILGRALSVEQVQ